MRCNVKKASTALLRDSTTRFVIRHYARRLPSTGQRMSESGRERKVERSARESTASVTISPGGRGSAGSVSISHERRASYSLASTIEGCVLRFRVVQGENT